MARARNYVKEAQAAVVGEPMVLAVDVLRPNKWNYNTQNEATFNKLVAAIRRHGFTKPVVVRTIDGVEGFEIVDGEHRWRAAKACGMTSISAVNLGVIEDHKAKELTIILNELSGKPDEVRLADLLRDIGTDVKIDELLTVMPYTQSELDMYMGAIDFSFDSLSKGDTRAPVSEEDEKDISSKEQSLSKRRTSLTWTGKAAKELEELIAAVDTDEDPEGTIIEALRFYAECKAAKMANTAMPEVQ